MLAAKRSFGNLRAAAARSTQPSPSLAAPASSHFVMLNNNNNNSSGSSMSNQQHQQPTRTLVSAVLLSRDQFEKKTVKQLQEELGERGLSTKGKKAALVDRLLENVSRNPPPSSPSSPTRPPTTSSFSTASASQYAASAPTSFSSSLPSAAASRQTTEAPSQINAVEGKVFTPSPVPSGSEPPTSGEEGKKDGKTVISAGPGLVIEKAEEEKLAATVKVVPGGSIEMPESATVTSADAILLPSTALDAAEAEIMIPTFPDQYKNPEGNDLSTQPFAMHRSLTQSELYTVHGEQAGVHHQALNSMPTDDPHSRSSEPRKAFQYAPDTTFLEEAFATLGIKAKRANKSAKKQSNSVLKMLQSDLGVPSDKTIKEVTAAASKVAANTPSKDQQAEYKFQDRELHSDERSGLYVLLGILGGGLALGGLGKKSQKEDRKDGEHKEH